ncbi:CMGC family protein kinase [Tritrichomonas foetus]|uniref:CMGC family protein kinase n=1 Tax=Tritrichomonas foetus TaxID=1144522 RepID=A0A1J4JIJ0_9EUKA|nr:CMGC family protein kinase [Tritrichomonas foetus]|eukprot:OHS97341.1 CMGC family protein kinase [Tritrichomonas foetus]
MSKVINERYQKLDILNDGAYGVVWLCKDIQTNKEVALKECQCCDAKVNVREIQALAALDHPNIIKLVESFRLFPYDYIILEYGGEDLQSIMENNPGPLPPELVKKIMYSILDALRYIHMKGFVHRDIKPANILINEQNELKLIDFGLCRPMDGTPLSPLCCTYQYTPLDCLLGAPSYNHNFDVWSAGCIFAEMLTGEILFDGDSQLSIVIQILKVLGTPKEEDWPEMNTIPYCQNFNMPEYQATIDDILKNADPEAIDLIKKMLCISQSKRISAEEALKHPYFAK